MYDLKTYFHHEFQRMNFEVAVVYPNSYKTMANAMSLSQFASWMVRFAVSDSNGVY